MSNICYSVSNRPKSNKIAKREYNIHDKQHGLQKYTILTCDKEIVCFNEPMQIRQYHSVIFKGKRLMSFAPPKELSLSEFTRINDDPDNNNNHHDFFHINEAMEGLLIHLFYDFDIESWQIATRNAIGGNYFAMTHKTNRIHDLIFDTVTGVVVIPTIYEMFMDALCMERTMSLNDVPLLSGLNKLYCYSMILQHPSNPMILPIHYPSLYLIAVYNVHQTLNYVESIPSTEYENWQCFVNSTLLFPKKSTLSYGDLQEYERSTLRFRETITRGLIATHLLSGERCLIQNPEYSAISRSRERDTALHYQYICLHRLGRDDHYLMQFPKQRATFAQFYKLHKEFIRNLHFSYLLVHVHHTWSLSDVSTKYVELIQRLHKEIYLPSLSKGLNKIIITKGVIREFLKKLHPTEMFYYLYHDERANNCSDESY